MDTIEISLLGGKFIGETLVIHLGDGYWGIIDSFNVNKYPASLEYLKLIKQDLNKVKFILLTHWHADHCRGIADTAKACPNAELWISDCFCGGSFIYFLELFNDKFTDTKFNSLKHVKEYLDIPRITRRASQDKLIYRNIPAQIPIEIYSLTPTDQTKELMEKDLKRMIKKLEKQEIALNEKKILNLKHENQKSVALLIKLKDYNIVLAGDLETDSKDGIGLKGIQDSKLFESNKTVIFKIPHHGSKTGYDKNIWESLLVQNPFLLLTPYKGGSTTLPTKDMIQVLCTEYNNIFISSNPYKKTSGLKHSYQTRKHLKEVGLYPQKIQKKLGHIRLRIKPEQNIPSIELFENAIPLNQIMD